VRKPSGWRIQQVGFGSQRIAIVLCAALLLLMTACSASGPPTETQSTADAMEANNGTSTNAILEPTPTPLPAPSLSYELPPTRLTVATCLYASPNRDTCIVPAAIPSGEWIFVMGKNATSSHLRAVWNTGVGWVPTSFTEYIGQPALMAALPVFEREPPVCAEPITTQFGLNSEWVSDRHQRIAVIVDLFRSKYGTFPASSLALRVNGVVIERSRRAIVEQGRFSLKDIVFSLPQDIQPDDRLGYDLQTSSDEPLTFMASIFGIPANCVWDTD
jgi:hypothetical protein